MSRKSNKRMYKITVGSKEFYYTREKLNNKENMCHFKDANGRYPNGRVKYKHIYASSEWELKNKIKDYLKSLGEPETTSNGDITIREVAEEWLYHISNSYSSNLEPVTIDKHESVVRSHIIPYFGNKPVTVLESKDQLSYFLKYLETKGNKKTGKGLSYNSMKHIYSTLKLISKYSAEKDKEYITYQAVDDIAPVKPKGRKAENDENDKKPYFDTETLEKIAYVCNQKNSDGTYKYHYRYIFLFTLYTGLRIEEACGLLRENCFLNEGYIKVETVLVRQRRRDKYGHPLKGYEHVLKDYPKNDSSKREVYLSKEAKQILKEAFELFPKSEYAFTNTAGERISLNLINTRFETICKAAGINVKDVNPYLLRHTFATRVLNISNMKIEVLAKIMGHSTPNTTYKDYFHQSASERELIAREISDAMDLTRNSQKKKCNVDLFQLSNYAKANGKEIYELNEDELERFIIDDK